MPGFTRKTILAATDYLAGWSHTEIHRFLLEHALDRRLSGNSRADRANALASYLIDHPDELNEDGENLCRVVVTSLVDMVCTSCMDPYSRVFDAAKFEREFPRLHRGLSRDGYAVVDGQLVASLPEVADLPQASDELRAMLAKLSFNTTAGHLNQGLSNHADGNWAAANSQFRTCFECLLDEIAAHLANGTPLPVTSEDKRRWLANSNRFLSSDLNEWQNDGKGFLQGFLKRLHPHGSHPGLSDGDDSTLRLHLLLIIARDLLRRVGR